MFERPFPVLEKGWNVECLRPFPGIEKVWENRFIPLESRKGTELFHSEKCVVCPTLTKPNHSNKKYATDSKVVHNETAKVNLTADDR